MKKFTALILPVLVVACSGRIVDLNVEDDGTVQVPGHEIGGSSTGPIAGNSSGAGTGNSPSIGGGESPSVGGGESSSVGGGESSSVGGGESFSVGGAAGGDGLMYMPLGSAGSYSVSFTRGGFADGMATLRDGAVDPGTREENCPDPTTLFQLYVYDVGTCVAASACIVHCQPDAEEGAPYVQYWDPNDEAIVTPWVRSECRVAPSGPFSDAPYAVHPCGNDRYCPSPLVCVDSELGPACLAPDVLWAPSCTNSL